jgi:hypothetical protein
VLSDPEKRRANDSLGSRWESVDDDDQVPGFDYIVEAKISILQAAKGHTRTVEVFGREVSITIPPGVNKWHHLRYKGCGGLASKWNILLHQEPIERRRRSVVEGQRCPGNAIVGGPISRLIEIYGLLRPEDRGLSADIGGRCSALAPGGVPTANDSGPE